MKKLPIGIQTFSKIIEENYYYIDKTKLVFELVNTASYIFLSRPRRFGKSLFLDTLKEAFDGNKNLFKGLFLENNWDWNVKYPILKIDLGMIEASSNEMLNSRLIELLNENFSKFNLVSNQNSAQGKFQELIRLLHNQFNQKVVILIDEYDKPILDNITSPEINKNILSELRSFYSVIKGSDEYIKFVFLTGVSKFSKINLFSGLNNLLDISLDKRFSSICGYTETELEIFKERFEGINLKKLKNWYNGYNFLGEAVYNPYDVLLFLDKKEFKNYWFETGNPKFLIDLIIQKKFNPISLEQFKLSESHLNHFDIESISIENLMFQTGYLTISNLKERDGFNIYSLKYPNLEVKSSFTNLILEYLTNSKSDFEKTKSKLIEAIEENNFEAIKKNFYSFFASIPNDWYRKNHLEKYEGYYSAIFYTYFTAIGLDARAEEITNHGQVDMTVILQNRVYVFEFKVSEQTETKNPLEQIKKMKYYEKYDSTHGKEIYLIGVIFNSQERNIELFEWEKV